MTHDDATLTKLLRQGWRGGTATDLMREAADRIERLSGQRGSSGAEQPFYSVRAFLLQQGLFAGRDHHDRVQRCGEFARELLAAMIPPQPTEPWE
ncbi:hypothetical protein [Microbacterium sp. PM5]|uniref:hypothetical protein n=1 Tax=Microbacterium sp. PM5 TaxID=2014534 RepID=UPI000DD165CD|nr:hypothetical protein [Microbacterium sp. PM5]AXA95442.1 hypothetical protein CEP17_02860 [Microbacterium sp. PM5]